MEISRLNSDDITDSIIDNVQSVARDHVHYLNNLSLKCRSIVIYHNVRNLTMSFKLIKSVPFLKVLLSRTGKCDADIGEILYALYELNPECVFEMIFHYPAAAKSEFIGNILKDGNIDLAIKFMDICRDPIHNFYVLSIVFRGQVEELMEMLDFMLQNNIITLKILYKLMRKQLRSDKFTRRLFMFICEKYNITISAEEIDKIISKNDAIS